MWFAQRSRADALRHRLRRFRRQGQGGCDGRKRTGHLRGGASVQGRGEVAPAAALSGTSGVLLDEGLESSEAGANSGGTSVHPA